MLKLKKVFASEHFLGVNKIHTKDGHEASKKALDALETIDDDLHDLESIKLVKIDDPDEALEYGLTSLPALVFFEHQMPTVSTASFKVIQSY